MKKTLMLAAAAATLALCACGQGGKGASSPAGVTLGGSSTVYPVAQAAKAGYLAANPKAKIEVNESGTGGGFEKFCAGKIDIADASRAISLSEMVACETAGVKYYELPIAFDAIAIVANPAVPVDQITAAELKKIWQIESEGKITDWSQVNPAWKKHPLKLYGPGAKSGTFDYFTQAINGTEKEQRTDITSSEDDQVLVAGIEGDPAATGYFGLSYYEKNKTKLKVLALAPEAGKPAVLPSAETVRNNTYQPLSRPIFIYVNADAYKSRADVKGLVDYWITNGAKLADDQGYVSLPADAYSKALERLKTGAVGTAFAGEQKVGMSIDQILTSELTLSASKPAAAAAPAPTTPEKK